MPTDEHESKNPRRRRRWWIAAAVLAALALAVMVAAAVVVRSQFTLVLDAAGPWLEGRIGAVIQPLRVRRGPLRLRWGGFTDPVMVRAEQWALLRADGEPFLELPAVEIALEPRPLLRGELQLQSLTLSDPRLTLDRDQHGAFAPDLGDLAARRGGEGSDEGGFAALLDGWLAGTPTGPVARLEGARIENGTLVVRDRALGLEWGLDRLRAEVSRRRPERIELAGAARATHRDASAASSPAEVPFTGGFDLARRRLDAVVEPDLELSRLAALDPALARLAELDLRLTGSAKLALGDGELVAAPVELSLGRGSLAGGMPVHASAKWAIDAGSFSIQASSERCDLALLAGLDPALAAAAPLLPALDADLAFDSTPGRGATLVATLVAPGEEAPFSRLHATVGFPAAAGSTDVAVEIETLRPWILASRDPALAPLLGVEIPFDGTLRGAITDGSASLRLELTGRPGSLQISGIPAEPLAIDALEIQGEIGGPSTGPRLEHGELALRAGAITTAAEVRPHRGGYSAHVELEAPALERADLDRFWPSDLAPGPRARTVSTFVSGAARDLQVVAELQIDPDGKPAVRLDSLGGNAGLDRVELDVLAPQPPISVTGSAEFDLDSVNATIEQARLGSIELGPGTVQLSGLRGESPALALDASWHAPLESVLALLGAEPLSVIKHPERIAGVTGSTRGEIHLEIPLGEADQPKRARIRARGDLADLEWANGPLGLQVSHGELSFDYGGDQIELSGRADAETSPTRFSLRHRFDGAEPRDTIRVSARLDGMTARALGLPEQRLVGGVIDIDGSYTAANDGAAVVEVNVDLTPAQLELASAGVSKPAGEAASARLDAALDPAGTLTVRSLVVDGRQLAGTARGVATTGPFRLESAAVENLRLGENRLSGSLGRRPDGGWTVAVDAARLDLRPFLDAEPEDGDDDDDEAEPTGVTSTAESAPAETSPGATFDFEARVGSLLLLRDFETGRLEGSGSWDGERWSRLAIDGSFDPSTPVSLDFDRSQPTGRLRFETNDLGRLLNALVSRAEIRGGELLLTAARTEEREHVTGQLTVRSFTLIKMPVFASILRLGTLDSLFGMFQNEGLEFKKLDAELEWDGRRLSVAHARAVGSGIVFTGQGDFDLTAGTIDFAGTVAHMGHVQRMIAKIPGISHLIMGRDRAGVVATQFRLSGRIAEPEVAVDPLSTFTPGFLRDLYGAGRQKVEQ